MYNYDMILSNYRGISELEKTPTNVLSFDYHKFMLILSAR